MRYRASGAAVVPILVLLAAQTPGWAQTNVDYLISQLNQRASQFASGYTLFGPIQTGRLRPRGSRNVNLVLTAGQCYRIIGVGDSYVSDLDVFLRIRNSTVAQDTATDNYPVVTYCPSQTERVQVRVVMYAGSGEYALGVFNGPGQGGIAPVFDSRSVVGRLQSIAATHAQGYFGLGDPIVDTLTNNASRSINVSLVQGVCYKFIGAGGPGVQDLDLHILVAGSRVAQDTATDDVTVASYCAPVSTVAQVQVYMYRGDGPFAYQTFQASRGPQPVAQTVPMIGGNDYIANRMREIHGQYGNGRAPVSPLMRGRLSTSAIQDFSVAFEAGHCYSAIAIGEPSVTDLDMFLFDPYGTQIVQDQATNNFPIVQACPSVPGNYRVQVKMYSGYGSFGLQIFGN